MTKEEEKVISLYEFFLKEKADLAQKSVNLANIKDVRNFRTGQLHAFKEMLSFTETLKRTL